MAGENQNKLEEVIKSSLESIRTMLDSNTVIGNPISTEAGVTIIPISKISVGYASGGIDFNGKNKAEIKEQNFGAGGGTGLSINPVGFLAVKKDGSLEMINVGQPYPQDPISQISAIIDRSPELFAKVKALFKKKEENAEKTDLDISVLDTTEEAQAE